MGSWLGIDSVEIGAKQRFADGKGRLAVTGYAFETQDQQLTAVGGAGNFNQLLNADGVQGFGFEVDLAFAPTENTAVSIGYSNNQTEIQDEALTVAACGAPCIVRDPLDGNGLALIDGNPLPQAAEHIFNATIEGTLPLADGQELFAYADVSHRSEVNFFLYESDEFRGDALTEVGAQLGYRRGNAELSVFGRNLLEEEELVGAVDFNNLTGFTNEPRQVGVALRIGL